jgi:hypothetical protein
MGRQEAIETYFNVACLSHTPLERLRKAIKTPKTRHAGFETSITGIQYQKVPSTPILSAKIKITMNSK